MVKQLLDHWRKKLSAHELLMLDSFSSGDIAPNAQDAFHVICLTSNLKDCAGPNLDCCPKASLLEASGKTLYQIMVKTLNRDKLNGRMDSPWRRNFDLGGSAQAWRSLYKPPLTKRHGDLQWRILHGAVAVNSFIAVINEDVKRHGKRDCSHCFGE